jgi:hypothetical protein
VSSKQTKINFGSNRNKPKQDLFRVCFVKPKRKKFGLFWCFEPISKQPKQTDLLRNKPKQTETTLNFLKNFQIYSLFNCLGGSSVCFGSIESLCFGIEAKQPKQTVSKQTEKLKKTKKPKKSEKKPRKKSKKNRKNSTFSVKKITKYAPYQTVSVGLLFVSVQTKHRNSLFQYRSETTKTNVLFRIVPKLVSVPVSVVSNRN